MSDQIRPADEAEALAAMQSMTSRNEGQFVQEGGVQDGDKA